MSVRIANNGKMNQKKHHPHKLQQTLNEVHNIKGNSIKRNIFIPLLIILFITALVYIPVFNNQLTNWDIYTLLFFVLSLFSKGMAVSLTITLIAIDYMMKRKVFGKNVMLEKIPFLILSAVFGIVAVHAQQSTASLGDAGVFSILQRICFASYGFVMYVTKLLLPFNLSAFYPYPEHINGHIAGIFYVSPLITAGLLTGI